MVFKKKEKAETELVLEESIGFRKHNETKHMVVSPEGTIEEKPVEEKPVEKVEVKQTENVIEITPSTIIVNEPKVSSQDTDEIMKMVGSILDEYLSENPEMVVELGDKYLPVLKNGRRCPANPMNERQAGYWDGYTTALYEILYRLSLKKKQNLP